MVVLDTCAIIDACKQSPSFSKSTVRKIDSGTYLLSISFAEIACKIKLGKLEMDVSPRTLFFEFSRINSIKMGFTAYPAQTGNEL
jgi:PIN domain nuclease of toxin-antitoxin system